MKFLFLLIGLVIAMPALAYKSYSPDHPVHVHSYERKDGTHVDDYYRSEPKHKRDNNL